MCFYISLVKIVFISNANRVFQFIKLVFQFLIIQSPPVKGWVVGFREGEMKSTVCIKWTGKSDLDMDFVILTWPWRLSVTWTWSGVDMIFMTLFYSLLIGFELELIQVNLLTWTWMSLTLIQTWHSESALTDVTPASLETWTWPQSFRADLSVFDLGDLGITLLNSHLDMAVVICISSLWIGLVTHCWTWGLLTEVFKTNNLPITTSTLDCEKCKLVGF